jgi:hypothetical protein
VEAEGSDTLEMGIEVEKITLSWEKLLKNNLEFPHKNGNYVITATFRVQRKSLHLIGSQ